MPLPVITDVWRCGLVQLVSGSADEMVTVIHLLNTVASDPQDVADDLADAWSGEFSSLQRTNVVYNRIDVIKLDGLSGLVPCVYNGSPDHGTNGSNEMAPLSTSICIRWGTGFGGRSNRGRTFLGGLSRGQVDQNTGDQLDGTFAATVQTNANAFISDLQATDSKLVVASYALASARQVTTAITSSKIATQRRRVNRR